MKLQDKFGRFITYLRISLTERCNLKCGYCYGENLSDKADEFSLSNNEIIRLIKAFAILGVDKVRFTGGEPLLRNGIVNLIGETSAIESVKIIGLTTNGLLLPKMGASLIDAGLNRLNISLDSLNRETFAKITGIDCFDLVLNGINLAEKSGKFGLVKINVVMMRGINDNEIKAFANWAIIRKIDLRFIEFMPTVGSGWDEKLFVGEDEMKKAIDFDLQPVSNNNSNSGPSKSYKYKNYPGRISFISALSRGFCDKCNRLRLKSTGDLIGCLFNSSSFNITEIVRDNAPIEELAHSIAGVFSKNIYRKSPDDNIIHGQQPSMKDIGG